MVAVQRAFVVLGGGEEQGRPAVAQGVQGDLGACEQFLDDDGCAGGAEGLLDEHVVNGGGRLGLVVAEQDALAQGQAIGLDGAAAAEGGGESAGGLGVGEAAGPGGRDAVPFHELLGKDLRGLELGGLAVGPPDAQSVLLEEVHDAQRQGIVGADDGEVGAVFLDEGQQLGQILGVERDTLDGRVVAVEPLLGDAGVAGGAPEVGGVRGLGELPDQGVFAAAGTDHKEFHVGVD